MKRLVLVMLMNAPILAMSDGYEPVVLGDLLAIAAVSQANCLPAAPLRWRVKEDSALKETLFAHVALSTTGQTLQIIATQQQVHQSFDMRSHYLFRQLPSILPEAGYPVDIAGCLNPQIMLEGFDSSILRMKWRVQHTPSETMVSFTGQEVKSKSL